MDKQAHKCEYCGKQAKSLAGLKAHQRHCKQNPKATHNTRKQSPTTDKILTIKGTNPSLPNKHIAELAKCSIDNVQRVLRNYNIESANLKDFKEHRADIFAGLQDKILKTITLDDIKKTSVAQKVTAVAILNDKERLERGQSTSNVASIHSDIKELRNHEGRAFDSDVPWDKPTTKQANSLE